MEAYRVLRTNIEFSGSVSKTQTIMLTSSVSQEGKSTTACNLAKVFAYAGTKTLLLELDLRRPVLHRFFHYDNTIGIMDYFLGKNSLEDAIKPTDVEHLFLLNVGTVPPNPAEVLVSAQFAGIINELREIFDIIIIDTPPVAALTDAAICSRFSDATLMIVSSDKTNMDDLDIAVRNLQTAGANILGFVMNNVSKRTRGYKHYSYYYKYYKYY